MNLVGKRWSLTYVRTHAVHLKSGYFIPIDVFSGFSSSPVKFWTFESQVNFCLNAAQFMDQGKCQYLGLSGPFQSSLSRMQQHRSLLWPAGPFVIRFAANLTTHGGRKVGSQSSTA